MRFATTTIRISAAKPGQSAFTLVEVLAALLFMAIVVPVAVDGVRVANRAGVAGYRKVLAARIAERLLNEAVVAVQSGVSTGEVGPAANQSGVDREGQLEFRWTLRNEPWNQSSVNDLGLTPTTQTTFNQTGSSSIGSGPAGTSPVTISDLNSLRQISAEVTFGVQNQNFSVRLTTMVVNQSQ